MLVSKTVVNVVTLMFDVSTMTILTSFSVAMMLMGKSKTIMVSCFALDSNHRSR